MSVFIIAEAGVNHNGSLDMAKKLIDVAADAGADAVKFQTFKASHIVSRRAPKAAYQERTTGQEESQFDMIRKLELSVSDHHALLKHAAERGIEFLSTPFDLSSLQLLVGELGLRTIKIPSGEITNAPLLIQVAQSGCRVILSTGMSTLGEIEAALAVLAFGFTATADSKPEQEVFAAAFASEVGRQALRERVTLLQCTTEYPAAVAEVNLRVMDTMAAAFSVPVGYSDHTAGIHIAVAAVARGAVLVEKHFTLDRTLPGPDHQASLEPHELAAMVTHIRDVELALGDGVKRPSTAELANLKVVRKSICAAQTIRCGEAFTDANLACKRPGDGISPMSYWHQLGRLATRDYVVDEAIDL